MANLLQSAQVKSTCAPSYYTDYLSNLATAGQQAQQQAQYVGAQPLQQQAFCQISQTAGATQPLYQAGANLVGQAAGQDVLGAGTPFLQAAALSGGYNLASPLLQRATGMCVAGAASPYIQQAAGRGGLCAAQPYLCQGVSTNISAAASPYLQAALQCSPSDLAASYMNPYIDKAVRSLSDIAQRNIQQNIAPQATAAAVGSGQYGSQRGAQVLGQLTANAEQDLNSQIANMLSTGYGQALGAAQQRQALLGQLGQTAGCMAAKQAQQALTAGQTAGQLSQQQQALLGQLGQTTGSLTAQQMQNLLSAGQTAGQLGQQQASLLGQLGGTAGCLAAKQAQVLGQSGVNLGTLAGQQAQQNIACINALATLGGQQQTIEQNRQLFPMSTLSSLAGLLQGYAIPTATKTTLCMSPLSGLTGLAATAGGIFQKPAGGGMPLFCTLKNLFSGKSSGSYGGGNCCYDPMAGLVWCETNGTYLRKATGGLVSTDNVGCASTKSRGALPKE